MNPAETPQEVPLRDSIATHLLRRVFFWYLTVAVLVTGGYLAYLHYETRQVILHQLQLYEETFASGLELHLWNLEQQQMDALTKGMLRLPYVVGIAVTEAEGGRNFSTAGVYSDSAGLRVGGPADASDHPLIAHRFDLHHHTPEGKVPVGAATIYSDPAAIWEAVEVDYLLVIGSALIKTAALWLIFLWFSRRHLHRPLRDLTLAAARIHLGNLEPVKIDLADNRRDELWGLTASFNAMLEKLLQARRELEEVNAGLERTVEARTRDLDASCRRAEEARAEAERANQAKSRFLANMSHEFRTPLNAILGFSEIMFQRCFSSGACADPGRRQYLETVRQGGHALLQLVDEVLDLARAEAGKIRMEPRPFPLRPLLESAVQMVRARAEAKGLELTLDLPDEPPPALLLDEARLRQVLLNLLSNAVKFTHRGEVRVRLETVWLNPAQSKARLTIAVEDSGIGIPAAERERVFEPFEQRRGQSEAEYGGTGLGLAISRQLVRMMGGDITVDERPGGGTVFTVRLPEVEVPALSAEGAQAGETRFYFESARLLVVDDIAANRELLRIWLEGAGFSCDQAANGDEALRMVMESSPVSRPAALLLDLKMPGLGGEEVARRLKASPDTAGIPLIAVTAAALPEEVAYYRGRFDGYLTKPVSAGALLECLAGFFPHRREEPEAQAAAAMAVPELSPRALAALREEILPWWRRLGKAGSFQEVAVFAKRVGEFAAGHGHEPMRVWALELERLSDDFDLIGIQRSLSRLSELAPASVGEGAP